MKVSCVEKKIPLPDKLRAHKCVDVALIGGKTVQFELESGKTITYEIIRVTRKNQTTGQDEWTVDISIPGGDPVQVQAHLNLRNIALPVVLQLHTISRKMNLQLVSARLQPTGKEEDSMPGTIIDPDALETYRSMFEDSIGQIRAKSEKYGTNMTIH